MVRAFAERGCSFTNEVLSSFEEQITEENNEPQSVVEIIQLLVDMNCFPSNDALNILGHNKDVASWCLLLEYGLDIYFSEEELTHEERILGKSLGSSFITEDLLNRGVNLSDIDGEHILAVAFRGGFANSAKAIIFCDEKALECIEKTPQQLFEALHERNAAEMISLLIDCGYDSRAVDDTGRNILHIACNNDEDKGDDIDEEPALAILRQTVASQLIRVKDNHGKLPVHYAVSKKLHRVVKAMVELQPDLIEEVDSKETKHRRQLSEAWERRIKKKLE